MRDAKQKRQVASAFCDWCKIGQSRKPVANQNIPTVQRTKFDKRLICSLTLKNRSKKRKKA